MKTKLEQLRDLLAGAGDAAAAETVRAELTDPASETSLFLAGAAAAAQGPPAPEWFEPIPEDAAGRAAELTSLLETAVAAGETEPTQPTDDWLAKTDLETIRHLLGGSAGPEPPCAGEGGGGPPPAAPPTASDTLDPKGPFPRPFGRYEVRARLGGGGMADVYRAYDTVLDVEVALKVPRPVLLAQPFFREQFLHEARALARLDHPNICRVYDYGVVGATPYLSMRLIHGEPLSRRRPAGPAEAVALAHTLALTLAVAHGQGVLHRDLKPANVLVEADGKPVLTDFGLALRLDSAAALLPGPGDVLGTLPYMPPEQVDVRLAPPGPGADIYALGAILYELLTGRPPFPTSDPEELKRQILSEAPAPPSGLVPGLPAALDRVCQRALAKRVGDRFVNMEEFAAALAPALAALIAAPAAGAAGPARPLVDRRAVRFAFAGYGMAAPPSAAFRDRLYLDVGNDLRPGVIDHHQLVMAAASSTRLVLNRPDLLDAVVAPVHRDDDPFTVVTHEFPDLDAVAAAFLATEYLATGRYPEGADLLARYVDCVDEGHPGMSLDRPFTLYAAYIVLANRPPAAGAAGVAQWQQVLAAGIGLVGHVLAEAVRGGRSLEEEDAFACPGLFGAAEREVVRADVRRYERKLADPRCRARAAVLRLPGRFGGREEAEALLVQDVQNEDDPERCLFFKDWARTDARRSAAGRGFVALSVFMTEGARQRRRCILSVAPGGRVSLRGLGELLDRAEAARRRALYGEDDRVRDPVTGAPVPPRAGYANADPWYDGRAHGYTIVDAPRAGTVLTAEEIEGVFLEFGGCGGSPRPVMEEVAQP